MDLHVIMAADNDYVPYMGTCILSLLENNIKCFEMIKIYIIDNGISDENKIKLTKQCDAFQYTSISFFDLRERFSAIHPLVENGWNNSIYGRFFLDDVVDKSVEKVLYLDSDTIVNASLEDLMTTDLTDYCLAGVTDISAEHQKELLGMPHSSLYINSGVLLVNMNKWRKLNITKKLIEFINTFPEKLLCPDQDALNAVCSNMTLILPVKYNYGWMLTERRLRWDYYAASFPYSYDEIYDTIKNSYENVVIFHYFGPLKPWRKGECPKLFEAPFIKYYKKSIWWQKRRFISRKKMLEYYFISSPKKLIIVFLRLILGIEKYDAFCDFWEKRKTASPK